MPYGFQVLNDEGRVIIDSNVGTANDYTTATETLAYTDAAFGAVPTGYQLGDNILARPMDSTTVRYNWVSLNWSGKFYGAAPTIGSTITELEAPVDGLVIALMRSQEGLAPSAGLGYGLEVFDSTGTNLIFTNDIPNMAEIMAMGQLTPNASPITYTIPDGYDPKRFFAVLDPTNSITYTAAGSGDVTWQRAGYRFDRDANPQTITVYNDFIDMETDQLISYYNDEMWYMIVYV